MSYDSYTKSLLHFNGLDASIVTVDEIGKSWTVAGTAELDTSQFKFGVSSAYFPGSNCNIYTVDSADFDYGSGDFTIDFWVRPNSVSGTLGICGQNDSTSTGASTSFQIYIDGGKFKAYFACSGTYLTLTGATSPSTGQWYHVAVVRNGNTCTLYLDGVSDGTLDMTGRTINNSSNQISIGRFGEYNGNYFNGWIDEFRFSKGIARWTSNFTPPTLPYSETLSLGEYLGTGQSDVITLMHFDGADASTEMVDVCNSGWTQYGNAQLDTAQYKFGTSSLLFDGTDDAIYQPTNGGAFAFGTGDFTIDFWVRINTYTVGVSQLIYDGRSSGDAGGATTPLIYWNPSNLKFVYYNNSADRIVGTTNTTTGVWYHVALVRYNGSTKLYLNGSQEGSTYTDTTNYTCASNRPVIGFNAATGTGNSVNGWIDELRIVKGRAMWTGNFTPETLAYADVTAYSSKGIWHLNGNSYDSSGKGNHGADTSISYSLSDGKFGQGASLNGSSSKIVLPTSIATSMAGTSFTVSGWVNLNSLAVSGMLFACGNTGENNSIISLGLTSAGNVEVINRNASAVGLANSSISVGMSTGVWYLWTWCCTTTNSKFYLNGNLKDDTNFTANTPALNTCHLGVRQRLAGYDAYFGGKMDEFLVENYAWSASQVRKYYTYAKGWF